MSTPLATRAPAGLSFERRRTLTLPVRLALAAAVLVAVAAVFALTALHGRAAYVVLAALAFVLVQGVAAAAVEGRRRAIDRTVTTVVALAFLLALAPLYSVVAYTVSQGATRFDGTFFTHSLRNIGARDTGGGAYHAIIGTLEQVGLATAVSVPFGLLVAVYVVEYGRGRLAAAVRFFTDVMTGIPSIVAGLFVLAFWILGLGFGASGLAASLALTVLMLPTIVRSSEEMLKLVPDALREASLALGVPRWKTILRIVLPTATPGIITGVMLAVARAMGETAPVLLTAVGSPSINSNPFKDPQASLPLLIYSEAGSPQQAAVARAWTAALTLILIVMALNLAARLVTRRSKIGA